MLSSDILGVALMQLEQKGPLLGVLDVLDRAISKVTHLVLQLAPYGRFVVSALASETLRMSAIERIEVYLLTFMAVFVVMALWALPGLVSSVSPIQSLEIPGPTRDAVITAFLVGELFIVLPMLAEASREILARGRIARELLSKQIEPHLMLHLGSVILLVSLAIYYLVNRREDRRDDQGKQAKQFLAKGNGFALVFRRKYILLLELFSLSY